LLYNEDFQVLSALNKNEYICNMNKLWVFLSVYLLFLSVYPCNDKAERDSIIVESAVLHADSHDKTHDHAEQCSPFCSCICCGVHTLHMVSSFCVLKEKLFLSEKRKQFNFYSFIYNKEISSAIWQAPRRS